MLGVSVAGSLQIERNGAYPLRPACEKVAPTRTNQHVVLQRTSADPRLGSERDVNRRMPGRNPEQPGVCRRSREAGQYYWDWRSSSWLVPLRSVHLVWVCGLNQLL